MAYYLESLSFIIISRFIYQPQSCENHMAQLSKLTSSCRFMSIFQKGITLFKMLQDFTFPDFDEIVTNMKYVYFGFNLARVCLAGVYIPYTLENFHV